jgi:hypothetical protein
MKKIIFLLLFLTILFACAKDEPSNYTGSIVIWNSQTGSEFYINDGAISLTVYFDNTIVGSLAASVYNTSAPDCDNTNGITIKKDLGPLKSKSFSVKIIDQTNHVYIDQQVTLESNTCISFEI